MPSKEVRRLFKTDFYLNFYNSVLFAANWYIGLRNFKKSVEKMCSHYLFKNKKMLILTQNVVMCLKRRWDDNFSHKSKFSIVQIYLLPIDISDYEN